MKFVSDYKTELYYVELNCVLTALQMKCTIISMLLHLLAKSVHHYHLNTIDMTSHIHITQSLSSLVSQKA